MKLKTQLKIFARSLERLLKHFRKDLNEILNVLSHFSCVLTTAIHSHAYFLTHMLACKVIVAEAADNEGGAVWL